MYNKRIEALQKTNETALLIDDPINMYYLTGMELTAGKVLVHKNGAYLIVDSRYFEACSKKSPISVVLSKPDTVWELLASNGLKKLAFSSEKTSFQQYVELQKTAQIKNIELIPANRPVETLRLIKDKYEIDLLRDAASVGSAGFDFVCTLLREGITEVEIAVELEIFWKRRGSKGLGFDPIIAFGHNSSMPHYRPGNTQLLFGQPVLIDIGVNWKHYHSDMTRVVFFGNPDPRIETIYEIVREAQERALHICKPGTTIGELDDAARGFINSKGYGDQFTHNLGHGVGLEIHEAPTVRNIPPHGEMQLKPGMVITIEPGIYLPDVGGVRIEDTVVITGEGHENLTKRSTQPHTIGGALC